jgi:hypothetical protein
MLTPGNQDGVALTRRQWRTRREFLFSNSLVERLGSNGMHKSDVRDGVRVQCEFPATIELGAGPAIRAVVRNISTCGARLEGADVVAAPEKFELLIMRDSGATVRRRARRVWRTDEAMGVSFIDQVGA